MCQTTIGDDNSNRGHGPLTGQLSGSTDAGGCPCGEKDRQDGSAVRSYCGEVSRVWLAGGALRGGSHRGAGLDGEGNGGNGVIEGATVLRGRISGLMRGTPVLEPDRREDVSGFVGRREVV